MFNESCLNYKGLMKLVPKVWSWSEENYPDDVRAKSQEILAFVALI